jgi:hypothetical protein
MMEDMTIASVPLGKIQVLEWIEHTFVMTALRRVLILNVTEHRREELLGR